MNVIKEIERINKKEFESGIYGGSEKGSWHDKYKNSAWVYIGGLPYELSEGDIICVMSQWGEIEDINLVREKGENKSKGFAFLKYEDQRSTILAVDNFNGITLLGRTLRVDHVDQYKLPKEIREREEQRLEENPDANISIGPGHAYSSKQLQNEFSIEHGQNLWAPPSSNSNSSSNLKSKQNFNDNHSDSSNGSGNDSDSNKSSSHHNKKSDKKKKKKKHHSKHSHKKESSSSSSKKRKYHSSDKDYNDNYNRNQLESIDDFMAGVLPLPDNVSSDYLMPKMSNESDSVPVVVDASGTILPPTGKFIKLNSFLLLLLY